MSLETAKLIKKKNLNTDIIECTLLCDSLIEAKPGQYVLLKVEDTWRPFSVAEVRDSNQLILIIQLIDNTMSANFFNNIAVGAKLELQEPRGDFNLLDKRDIVLIATGTGIVPLYTIAKHLLDNNYRHKVNIIFGIQSEEKLFYEEKLDELASTHPNCRVIITVSQPSREWTGKRGHVNNYILDLVQQSNDQEYFICGRNEIVASLVQLLELHDVPSSKINFVE